MQSDNAATAVTGPTFKDRVDPAARRAELEAIVELANSRRGGLKRLGEFSIASARVDDDWSYFTQIRAIPLSRSNGCEFRFDVPARHTGRIDVEERVQELLEAAAVFSRLRGMAKYVDVVRDAINEAIAPASDCLSPVRLVAVGVTIDVPGENYSLVADLERTGNSLQLGIDRISAADIESLEGKLEPFVAKHIAREKLRNLAAASRAIGWIDEAALRIVDASGMTRPDAYALMRDKQFVEFYFGGADGHDHIGALYWDEGVIIGHVDGFNDNWSFSGDRLTMPNPGLPETVLSAWPGRRFGDVVENRFIPADAIVTNVESFGMWLYVDMVIANRLVDEAHIARAAIGSG